MMLFAVIALTMWCVALTGILVGISIQLNEEDRTIRKFIAENRTKNNKEIHAIMDHLKLMFKDEPSHLSCVKRTKKENTNSFHTSWEYPGGNYIYST